MKVKIDGQEDDGRHVVEARDGDRRLDDGKGGGGRVGDEPLVCRAEDGERGVGAAREHGEEDLPRAVRGFLDGLEALEIFDLPRQLGAGYVGLGELFGEKARRTREVRVLEIRPPQFGSEQLCVSKFCAREVGLLEWGGVEVASLRLAS